MVADDADLVELAGGPGTCYRFRALGDGPEDLRRIGAALGMGGEVVADTDPETAVTWWLHAEGGFKLFLQTLGTSQIPGYADFHGFLGPSEHDSPVRWPSNLADRAALVASVEDLVRAVGLRHGEWSSDLFVHGNTTVRLSRPSTAS